MKAMRALVIGAFLLAPRVALADDVDQCLDASSTAQDLRTSKKLLEAKEKLLVCAREACPPVVKRDCAKWLNDVESALPTVVVTAKDEAGRDLVDGELLVDGKRVTGRLDGQALGINPGVHAVSFSSVNGKTEQQVVIREGEKNRPLELRIASAKPTEIAPPPPPPPKDTSNETPDSPDSSSGLGGRRVAGIATAGVGIVGLALGAVFGIKASSQWSDAKDACSAGCASGSDAYSKRDDAKSSATLATVGFVAGGVLLAGGAVLFFSARPNKTPQTALWHLTPNGVGGTF